MGVYENGVYPPNGLFTPPEKSHPPASREGDSYPPWKNGKFDDKPSNLRAQVSDQLRKCHPIFIGKGSTIKLDHHRPSHFTTKCAARGPVVPRTSGMTSVTGGW